MEKINKESLIEKLTNKETFIVQYSANWCNPCRVLAPMLENVCDSEKIKVYKFDIGEDPSFAKEKSIMSIPYVEFVKDGEVVAKKVGSAAREFYEEQIKASIL